VVAGPKLKMEARGPGRPRGRFTQHKRMSELQQLLYRHPKGVTLAEIAAHLHVTVRSARRYLSEMDLDLESSPERPGGQKRWRIPPVDVPRRVSVRRTQAYALLAARALFEPMRGSTLYEEIDLVRQTLLGVARRPGRGPNAGVVEAQLEERFRYLPFAPKDYSSRSVELDDLFQAVADLRPMSCRYPRRSDGELERLVLHPYALLLYKDAIYSLALDTASGEVRTFTLEHLRRTRCHEGERFAIPMDFDVEDYVQGQFGIWRQGEQQQRVVIEFHPGVREYIATRAVHPSQRVEQLDSGKLRMELTLSDLTEVATWVLGFGHCAEVLEPAELRQRVRDELAATLGQYE
jgi:predicted DNA-binding transcriptional regulator YafY